MPTIFRFANFAESLLARPLASSGTVVFIDADDLWRMPALLSSDDRFAAVIQDGVQEPEVIYVTANPGDGSLDIERGREGSTAKAWPAGSSFAHTQTRDTLGMGPGAGGFEWEAQFRSDLDAAIASIHSEITVVADDTSALAQRVDTVEAKFNANSAQIQTIAQAYADAEAAAALYRTTLTATVNELTAQVEHVETVSANAAEAVATVADRVEVVWDDAQALVSSEATTRANADLAEAAARTTVQANLDTQTARIDTEITTRSTADAALATRSSNLEATVNDPTSGLVVTRARLLTEETTRASETSALAGRAATLESTVNSGTDGNLALKSRIATEETTRANADSTQSGRITTLESSVNDGTTGLAATRARLISEEGTRASETGALATRSTTLEAQMANTAGSGLQTRISNEESARVSGDGALATRASTLEAQMADTAGSGLQTRISTEETARANGDSALSTRTTTLESSINDSSTGLSALNATVTTQASVLTTLSNQAAEARLKLVAVASGATPALFSLESTSYGGTGGSNARIVADQIFFGDETVFSNTTKLMTTTLAGKKYVKAYGPSFGTGSDLRDWIGDDTTADASRSKDNADYYISTVPPFIGGKMLKTSLAKQVSVATTGQITSTGDFEIASVQFDWAVTGSAWVIDYTYFATGQGGYVGQIKIISMNLDGSDPVNLVTGIAASNSSPLTDVRSVIVANTKTGPRKVSAVLTITHGPITVQLQRLTVFHMG